MNPEFQRVLVRVFVVGGAMIGISAAALAVAFRAYGTARDGDHRHIVMVGALLAFIFVACAALFFFSLRR